MIEPNLHSSSSRINAEPTKTFFVDMLTRDIELEDAILDLLDNCVDGIQRTGKSANGAKPYEGFWAKITFSEDEFKIEDNCGGIDLEIAKTYAFRMGRPTEMPESNIVTNTIGTYGIGMKRSIFKIGKSSQVISQTVDDCFKVIISPAWLTDGSWDLPFESTDRSMPQPGTVIRVCDIREPVAERFRQSSFDSSLIGRIEHYYSYIIKKGFAVSVNNHKIGDGSLGLLWEGIDKVSSNSSVIAPYLYKSQYEDVSIELAVGFYQNHVVTEEEIEKENEGQRRSSSENAGWTIVCNDRVVEYRNKTRLTGWGEAGVPSYHPQFISIAGVVHFRCSDPRKLPITTTKRGLDLSSELYLYTKEFMREGLKIFTSYTNKWKKNISKEKAVMKEAQLIDPVVVIEKIPETTWKKTSSRRSSRTTKISDEKYYKPPLPLPDNNMVGEMSKRVVFTRKSDEIRLVSEYLFEDENRSANEVGNECFDKVLKEAQA
jgi:hypothetical protein